MLTAAGALGDRVTGLQLGADDYLAKPFAFAELVARVRALAGARRGRAARAVAAGDLSSTRRAVTRGDGGLDLTLKEFGVLERSWRSDGAVVSAEDLLERSGTRTPIRSPTRSG